LKIAVLTSGGDAPGLNAALRAVARTAFSLGWEVTKVEAGYKGLLEGRVSPIDSRRLGGIIGRGGTILGTQRSKEFQSPEENHHCARADTLAEEHDDCCISSGVMDAPTEADATAVAGAQGGGFGVGSRPPARGARYRRRARCRKRPRR